MDTVFRSNSELRRGGPSATFAARLRPIVGCGTRVAASLAHAVSDLADLRRGVAESVEGYQAFRRGTSAPPPPAPPVGPWTPGTQRKYVYMSGLGSGPNPDPANVVESLQAYGVPRESIIIHHTPFLALLTDLLHAPQHLLPNLEVYQGVTDPASRTSRRDVEQLEQELQAAGVSPQDPITLIGHSAGGQEASTLSYLLNSAGTWHVDTVVSLGTPFERNNTPSNVRMVSVESPQDGLVNVVNSLAGTSQGSATLDRYPDSARVNVHVRSHWRYLEPHNLASILGIADDPTRQGSFDLDLK